MTRWRLTIEYDGRPFMGWQRQDHGPSVQQALEEAIYRMTGELTAVHAAFVEKMQKAVSEGPSPEAYADMMKAWGPMSEAGLGMWRQMLEQMSGKPQS